MSNLSELHANRLQYQPKCPKIFDEGFEKIRSVKGDATSSVADSDDLKNLFSKTFGQEEISFQISEESSKSSEPFKVGVVLSGGPAPGGHNVILGLFDGLKKLHPDNQLFGFRKGPSGIIENQTLEITQDIADAYRNTGGFDIIQSGRTKIETPEQFASCLESCQTLGLKALLVIGGDDSNTNAAVLAHYFLEQGSDIQVVGAPKTIDGDLKNEKIEVSFGFDTACKTYAEMVGNICRDAISSAKYWHFIKLMGRSASHITLEVALQTQVNITLIGEEVEKRQQTLSSIVSEICDDVAARSEQGKDYGVILVPEGLIEFIPEMGQLISNLNDLLAEKEAEFNACTNLDEQITFVTGQLESANATLFSSLPAKIQAQLIADRDPHGNVQVSLIETEQLLAQMVAVELEQRQTNGSFKGKFSSLHHFFGYEGRCASPSNFDTDYAYGLGMVACLLIEEGCTGYIASLQHLEKAASEWIPAGVPLTSMMNMERRHGKDKPVIRKALVELDGKPFKVFTRKRDQWKIENAYLYPGPIQYFGPESICDRKPATLVLERED